MKRLLLAIGLVLAMAIPAFGQNGPVRIKPLMIPTFDTSGYPDAWFNVGETINVRMYFEVKGTGPFRVKIETRNSAGVLMNMNRFYNDIDSPTFQHWMLIHELGSEVAGVAGYYTLKATYVDVATGNTWSHQTKIHVSAPD
jgi:hypothetical protein